MEVVFTGSRAVNLLYSKSTLAWSPVRGTNDGTDCNPWRSAAVRKLASNATSTLRFLWTYMNLATGQVLRMCTSWLPFDLRHHGQRYAISRLHEMWACLPLAKFWGLPHRQWPGANSSTMEQTHIRLHSSYSRGSGIPWSHSRRNSRRCSTAEHFVQFDSHVILWRKQMILIMRRKVNSPHVISHARFYQVAVEDGGSMMRGAREKDSS